MEKQKEFDEKLPIKDRVGIGGMVQILILNKDGYSLCNYKAFSDYETTYCEILENTNILWEKIKWYINKRIYKIFI